jgi:acyl transferase domain-containing protein/thioesterase domain-containing protein/SAM-dependent methyltransferase
MDDVGGEDRPEAIAIIGLAGRFPGAESPEELWAKLCEGRELVSVLGDDELARAGVSEAELRDARYVRARGKLCEVEGFDPDFFGMSPREAALTDPQHRLFLECAWEALEQAGVDPARASGPIGVFGGAAAPGYLIHHVHATTPLGDILRDLPAMIGNDKDHLTTRVAYKLDLRGPAITVQTACSTGLVAVHAACQSLLGFQCDLALAGAVSIQFPLDTGYTYREGNIASPDGHCRAFDAEARGAVGGDGVAVVALKRLSEALADGDPIVAVLRAVAVNNDGAAKVGYAAPSLDGQAEVIALAQALAEVEPDSIGYVEAHGTGTALGDPLEIEALTRAFRSRGSLAEQRCALGSLKTNIGHLNTAAGIAGLIKAIFVVERGLVPPSLFFETPNPAIDFRASPFYVSRALHPFPARPGPRRAGVSSFGIGGTNAHAVIEEAPPRRSGPWARSAQLLPLSARTPAALELVAARLADHLERHPEQDLADIAHTLQRGRRAFAARRFVRATSHAEAIAALRGSSARQPGSTRAHERVSERAEVAFLFPGQGAQQQGMARALYRSEPAFRAPFDQCAALLAPRLGLDLRASLDRDEPLRETRLLQPSLFALEYSLATLWMSLGVEPQAMLGHSLGEYVAACLAGVFSLEDALSLVATRGRLMQDLPPGAMLAVPLGERELGPLLGPKVALAALNGPEASVLSGPEEAIAEVERRLARDGLSSNRLRTSHAFHSPMMDPMLGAFRSALRSVRLSPPKIPYLGNVSGTWITEAEATDPDHWIRHLRGTVRFSAALDELLRDEGRVLLEVGPGRTLSALAAQQRPRDEPPRTIHSLSPSAGERSDEDALLDATGRLWASGVAIDWRARDEGRRLRVALPTYPFERERCWIDRPTTGAEATATSALPALDEAEATIRAELAIVPLERYAGLTRAFDTYCATKLVGWLAREGIAIAPGSRHPKEDLARRLGVVPALARLFEAFLAILAEDELVRIEGEELVFTERALALPDASAQRRALDEEHPALRGLYDLVDHCVAHYPEALRGVIPAIGVLYPGGSAKVIEASERGTAEHRSERVYISLLVEAVTRLVARSPKRLSILEIGGGRGTLTWPLLRALGGRADYCFTDLGRVFVDDAAKEAARQGLDGPMRFGLLDIGGDPREQGFEPGSFDLVVAFNVVHATRDVPAALRNLAALLAPGGTIGLVEVVKTERWDTLTWGLAEGWWYYDDALRTSSPLLDLGTWERALGEAGFEGATAYPRSAEERRRQDHGLVLGKKSEASRPATAVAASAARVEAPARARRRAERAQAFVAPRNEVERKVARACEEIVGVDAIGARDDLYELGADSLVMLRIMDRLRGDPALTVPAGAAFRGATVEKIASAISGNEGDLPASSVLVPLQPSGSRPPLFFVHPAAGVVFPYVELARLLGDDQPFYGVQAVGLDGLSEPDQHIEDMARRYVEALRAVQPKGPYHLGGFSFGCLVAFEMAQQLARAGEEIALLALVDEPAPVMGHRPSSLVMGKLLATGIARSIWPYLHDYFYLRSGPEPAPREAPPGASWRSLLREGPFLQQFLATATMANFVPRESRLVALRQPAMVPMFELFLVHLRETMAYVPKAYPYRVTLFRATRLGGRFAKDPTMGWGLLAAGGVAVHDLPGEHLTVLRRPHVLALAEALRRCLDEASRAPAARRGGAGRS